MHNLDRISITVRNINTRTPYSMHTYNIQVYKKKKQKKTCYENVITMYKI